MDETYVGGRTRWEGRGTTHEVLVAGAVEVRLLEKPRRNGERQLFAGRLRLALVPSRRQPDLEGFVQASVEKGGTVVTDAWTGYDALPSLGYEHHPITIGGDQSRTDESLPMIHLVSPTSRPGSWAHTTVSARAICRPT